MCIRDSLGTLGDDRVDLANTARYGGLTALQQGFVGLAHGFLIHRSSSVWFKDEMTGSAPSQHTMIDCNTRPDHRDYFCFTYYRSVASEGQARRRGWEKAELAVANEHFFRPRQRSITEAQ